MKTVSFRNAALLIVIVGMISGILSALLVINIPQSEQQLRKEFYNVETAVHSSPHHIRKAIAKGDNSFILVDLRSQEEYEEEHIVGAFSVPAYATPDKSAYGDVERIVRGFREIREQYPEKVIIVYCYSIPCMTGRKIGKMLADNEVYVKHLGVGWNEWRYFWTLWNHPREWERTNVEDYVASGPEPGEFTSEVDITPCIPGQFGC